VSVQGEFQRVLGDYLAFLRETTPSGAERWTAELETTARLARDDLSEGAERLLAFLADAPPPQLPAELERQEFARHGDHLCQICRVILGR
jgi:hypothetical protein